LQIKQWIQKLELRAKITLVILGVLAPILILLTLLSKQFVRPFLLAEAQQVGISVSQTITSELVNRKYLSRPNAEALIEERLREFSYLYPNIRRIEVFRRSGQETTQKLIASTVEEDPNEVEPVLPLTTVISSRFHSGELNDDNEGWEIIAPIDAAWPGKDQKIVGTVRLYFSTQLVRGLARSLSTIILFVGGFGGVILFFVLNAALRRTIENDRKLREAETQNLKLSEQLHEVERNLMNLEKFSALGQLTASFAHEIGTPLNAIGGHLMLLKRELLPLKDEKPKERIEVVEGQVSRITSIVRSFLQSTAQPESQKQLLDPHLTLEKSLQILAPRLDAYRINVKKNFDRSLGPIRMVPIDLEQVILNLLNNSIDGLRVKPESQQSREIEISTDLERKSTVEKWVIRIRDTGVGIASADLSKVVRPFFTTKAPGEGTGLGLSICQDILRKYQAELAVDSEQGSWTEVSIFIPFQIDEGTA
jgi:signal transduction histidine kinase